MSLPLCSTQHSGPIPFEVRIVWTPSDRDAVARLRYEVYVEEMGRTQPHANHANREIHEPLDKNGIVIGAFLPDGRAIGTIRVNSADDVGAAEAEFYDWSGRKSRHPGQVCLVSKLIVASALRGSLVSIDMMRCGIRIALGFDWRIVFLDANDHLLGLYARLGFVARERKEHPLHGSVTIMEWDMQGFDHMRAVRSPLLPDCIAGVDRRAFVA